MRKLLLASAAVLALSVAAQAQQPSNLINYGSTGGGTGGSGGSTTVQSGNGISVSGSPCTTSCTISTGVTRNDQTGASYAVVSGDGGKFVTFANASAIGVSLSASSTAGFGSGFGADFYVRASSVGVATITPASGTIAGLSTLVVQIGQLCETDGDGTNYDAFCSVPLMAADTMLGGGSAASFGVALVMPACINDGSHASIYTPSTHAWNCASISGGGGGAVSSVFGRTGAVVAATNDYSFAQISGNFTLAQFPSIANNTILANISGGSAVPTAMTVNSGSNCGDTAHALGWTNGTGLVCQAITGTNGFPVSPTTGDMVYWSGSAWVSLADVAVNQVITSGGIGAIPAWSGSPQLGTVQVSQIKTTGTAGLSNIANVGTGSSSSAGQTTATLLPSGTSTIHIRDVANGSSALTLTANDSAANFIFGQTGGDTEAASGTHPLIANVIVLAIPVTNGVGATTDTANLYVAAPDGGITPTDGAYSIWSLGADRVDGLFTNKGITSDATHTDASVCEDTTTHIFYSGSGTLGVCLGTSSLRYKSIIGAFDVGLDEVMQLKPIHYLYKKGYGDNGAHPQYGFGAEDVVNVLPQLVAKDKNGLPNSVDMLGMVPVLVAAIQKQQHEIDELKGRRELGGMSGWLHRNTGL